MADDRDALVARAMAYPFERPASPYALIDGTAFGLRCGGSRVGEWIVEAAGGETPLAALSNGSESRTPVIAWGSNASPTRLGAKLADAGVIAVARGELADFAAVHSAHLTAYGSVPATGQRVACGRATVFVAFLSAAQLDRLHATEALGRNYGYFRLDGLDLVLDGGGRLASAGAYLSLHGCLAVDGAALALAEAGGDCGPLARVAQTEALSLARDRVAPGTALDDFIVETVTDPAVRADRIARLREAASVPFAGTDAATRLI